MNVKINSVHFRADEKLEEFIQKKIDKVTQYHDSIVEVNVFLRVENTSDRDNKIAEVKIVVPGNDFFVKKQCSTFEEGIDLAMAGLKKQMLKSKEKIRG